MEVNWQSDAPKMIVKWQNDAPKMELKVPSEVKIDGYIPTAEDLTFTGDCSNLFDRGKFSWVLEHYTSQLQFNNITHMNYGFRGVETTSDLSNLIINLSKLGRISRLFSESRLSSYPQIKGEVYELDELFYGCNSSVFPEDFFDNLTFPSGGFSIDCNGIFSLCKKLIKAPDLKVFKKLDATANPATYRCFYKSLFYQCEELQRVQNMPIVYGNSRIGSNLFDAMLTYTEKLSSFTFEPNQTARFRNQELNFQNTGYRYSYSGSHNIDNSVYNHDSAVETINSLPDTSAFLAEVGGTNTIRFYRNQGANTEGGAIGNLTAEEIAIAAAKGWTVALYDD